MAKYNDKSKWFVARCFAVGVPLDEFQPLARRVLEFDVPASTYSMQRSYLRHRTPEDMGQLDTVALADLKKMPVISPALSPLPVTDRFSAWLLRRCKAIAMPFEECRKLARRLLVIELALHEYEAL